MSSFAARGIIHDQPLYWAGLSQSPLFYLWLRHSWPSNDRSHAASDTLYGVFPYWGVTFLLWDWSARRLKGT
jgi:hypothetical protein